MRSPGLHFTPMSDAISTTAQTHGPPADDAVGVSVWERASFECARFVIWLIVRVVGLNGLYRVGSWLGTVEWAINFKRRRRFAKQMQRTFGSADPVEARGACRRYFVRTRCDKLFYLILDKLPRDRLLACFEISSRDLIESGLERGRGVYIALSHLGSHHILWMLLAASGYPSAGVRDRKEGAIRRYARHKFEQTFPDFKRVRTFYSGDFPRDIFRCLQDNFLLGTALDVQRVRDPKLRTVDVEFFGQRQAYLTGTLQIALRCRSTILQGFIVSGPNFHYRLELLGPLVDSSVAKDTPEVLQEVMQVYTRQIEDFMRRYPCHVSRI